MTLRVFPAKLNAADLCDLIYYWLVKDVSDSKQRYKIDLDLTIPPPNITPDEDDPMWSAEAEMAAFKSNKR